jgi:hypothetical protein
MEKTTVLDANWVLAVLRAEFSAHEVAPIPHTT